MRLLVDTTPRHSLRHCMVLIAEVSYPCSMWSISTLRTVSNRSPSTAGSRPSRTSVWSPAWAGVRPRTGYCPRSVSCCSAWPCSEPLSSAGRTRLRLLCHARLKEIRQIYRNRAHLTTEMPRERQPCRCAPRARFSILRIILCTWKPLPPQGGEHSDHSVITHSNLTLFRSPKKDIKI